MNEAFKIYELKEVASILKINIRVLRRYINEGKIRASKIGRKYVIKGEDLDAYLQSNSKGSITNNDAEVITEEQKALLEAMLVKATNEDKNTITINLEEVKKAIGKQATQEDLEASLEALADLRAIKKDNNAIYKANIIGSYAKIDNNGKNFYIVELSEVIVKQFKENMLINTKIVRK